MKIFWGENEFSYKFESRNAFEELVNLIHEREDIYQKEPHRFFQYTLVLGHRWLTGAPRLNHPLVSPIIDMRRWERWDTLRHVLRVQLYDSPPESSSGDIRTFAGFGYDSWPSISHSLVDEFWEWRRKEHNFPSPFDRKVEFCLNSVFMDIDNYDSREFVGDTDISSGFHFWEIQLMAPCLLANPFAMRIGVGITIRAAEGLYTYMLTNKGDLIFRMPKARGRYLRKLCPPIYVGDRIGVAYDGSTDQLRFVVNDVNHDVKCVISPMTEFNRSQRPKTSVKILPYVRVSEGCISFSLNKKKSFGTSLLSLSSAAVMRVLLEDYYVSDEHNRWLRPMWFDKEWLWIKRKSLVTKIKTLPLPGTLKESLEGLLPPKDNY